MTIRPADIDDLPEIERIYDAARRTMRKIGNHSQWIGGYPQRELLEADIANSELFLIESGDGAAHGVFMFSTRDDETYHHIDGAWLNDEPYGVIHRIASDGTVPGVMAQAIEFARGECPNTRIDTHEDNSIMRHLLEREGFEECGTIICQDGTSRIAYQSRGGSE